jgi:hypothetical protein
MEIFILSILLEKIGRRLRGFTRIKEYILEFAIIRGNPRISSLYGGGRLSPMARR